MTGAFFIVGWIAPTAIGFQPQHPGDGTRPFLTVAWEPRLGTTEIAYDPADGSAVRLDL